MDCCLHRRRLANDSFPSGIPIFYTLPFLGAIVGRSILLLFPSLCGLNIFLCSHLRMPDIVARVKFTRLLVSLLSTEFQGCSVLHWSHFLHSNVLNCETLETPNFLASPWPVQDSLATASLWQNLHQNSAPALFSTWVSDSWRNLKQKWLKWLWVQQTKQIVPFIFGENTSGILTCLMVGVLPLIIILITASLSSKMYSLESPWEDCALLGTWSTWDNSSTLFTFPLPETAGCSLWFFFDCLDIGYLAPVARSFDYASAARSFDRRCLVSLGWL